MSYIESETDNDAPIELYRFSYGPYFWRYTDADETITSVDGEVYAPEAITRESYSQSEESNTSSVVVTVDAESPIGVFFNQPYLQARHMWLTISRTHRGSTEVPGRIFIGQVGAIEMQGSSVRLTCMPLRQAMQRKVPVQLIQSLCTNTLYDQRCKADPALYTVVGTITGVNGLAFTVSGISGKEIGYFSGGYIINERLNQFATIRDHTDASTLQMLYNPGYVPGDTINVVAGCDKKLTTCGTKFHNIVHFQGFPFFPEKDPFTTQA